MEKQVTAVMGAASVAPVAEWLATTEPLIKGFWAVESETGKYKIGDGIGTYEELPYAEDKFLTPVIRAKITNFNTANAFVQTDNDNKILTTQLKDDVLKTTASVGTPDETAELVIIKTNTTTGVETQVRSPIVKMRYYPTLSEETAILSAVYTAQEVIDGLAYLDNQYPVGDCRRYGIFPDGTTNWEGLYGKRVTAWAQCCAIPKITGYVPPGILNTGFNFVGSEIQGIRIYFDRVEVRGIFHVMSSAIPAAIDPILYDMWFLGEITCFDRLGITNVGALKFGKVKFANDPAKNISTPGVGGRGLHAYFGIDGLEFEELDFLGCVSTNNTDACFSIDGATKNPKGIRSKYTRIRASDTHAMYLTGSDHQFDHLLIDSYGLVGYGGSGMQDSTGLPQSQEVCGLWANRVWNSRIKRLEIGQNVSGLTNTKYHLRVSETGLSDPKGTLVIDELILRNVGTGTGERSMCIGDRNHATGSKSVNVKIGTTTIEMNPTGTLESGYQLLQVNGTVNGTIAKLENINFINPGNNTGIFVEQTNTTLIKTGHLQYEAIGAGGTATGTAMRINGKCYDSGTAYYSAVGSSTTNQAFVWGARPGSVLGSVEGYAASPTTKPFLVIGNANYTRVTKASCEGFRSTVEGVIAINNTTNFSIGIDRVYGTAVPVAGTTGLRLTGTLSDIRFDGGFFDGYDMGIAKSPSNLDLSNARICFNGTKIGSNNTTKTNLTSLDYLPVGEVDFGNTSYDTRKIHVSRWIGRDIWNGMPDTPKATIANALSSVLAPAEIVLGTSTWTENLTLALTNLTIVGVGRSGSNTSGIAGTITANSPSNIVRMSNININHFTATGYIWNATNANFNLKNINFLGSVASFTTAVTAGGTATLEDCDFVNSTAASNIVLPNLSSGTATLRLNSVNRARVSVGTGWLVYITDCPNIQIVSNSGTLIYTDVNVGLPYVNKVLATQAELTALVADTSVATDGYYICDFVTPSVGSRGDILYKVSVNTVSTSVLVNRPFNQCPATIYNNDTSVTLQRIGSFSWSNVTSNKITIDTNLPSGGNNGDIWYHVL